MTVFSDDAKKYLSDLDAAKEQPKPGFISSKIELISVDAECICDKRIINGSCETVV